MGGAEGTWTSPTSPPASRNNPTVLFGAATDTTTFVADPDHDLSGGGTRVVAPSDVSVHPGTLVNLSTSDDRYDLSISVANLYQVDGLLHPTELWADTDDDGIPDLAIATDDEGDGTWNTMLRTGTPTATVFPTCR